jgi:hypothetical protein
MSKPKALFRSSFELWHLALLISHSPQMLGGDHIIGALLEENPEIRNFAFAQSGRLEVRVAAEGAYPVD